MIGIGHSSLLRYNLKQWMELLFLNEGMYVNVNKDIGDYYGHYLATLKKDGIYFESPANEWAYESDVTAPSGYDSPISVSGVWINNVFHANDSAPYYPKPDYAHGRFRFNGTVPAASALVQANYSHKEVLVDYPDSEKYNLLMSDFLNNPDFSTDDIYPSGMKRLLPIVIIDLQSRSHEGRQVGGGKIIQDRVNVWVYAARDWERDAIMDIIFNEARSTIKAADYNSTPEILTFYGEKAATYKNFTYLGTTYPWTNIYIDKASIRERDLLIKTYKGRLELLLTVYQNP